MPVNEPAATDAIATGHEHRYRLDRRTLLSGAGAIGAALASSAVLANHHEGHDSHAHEHHAFTGGDLLAAASDCSNKGRRCLAHCITTFQRGDTSLADCAKKVNEMISLCDAFAQQVAMESPYVDGLAKVCSDACRDCEKECRKHAEKHAECRDGADACAALVSAINRM